MITATEILNASVLIVDDQQSNILLLEEILREAGYTHVSSTMDPHAVAALHRKNRYDLILLDLQMPGLNGFQVMENLKAIETESYIPVLVITAQPAHKLQALQGRRQGFVSKPFDLTEVKTRIHNLLEVRLLYRRLDNYNKVLEQTVEERTAELRESEARFRALTELASDWYWESDEHQRVTKVSGRSSRCSEYNWAHRWTRPGYSRARAGTRRSAPNSSEHQGRRPFLDLPFSRVNPDGSHSIFGPAGNRCSTAPPASSVTRGIGVEVTGTSLRQSPPPAAPDALALAESTIFAPYVG